MACDAPVAEHAAAPLARAPAHPVFLGGLLLAGVFVNTCAASINTHVFLYAAPIAVAWFRQIVAAVTLTALAAGTGGRLPAASRRPCGAPRSRSTPAASTWRCTAFPWGSRPR